MGVGGQRNAPAAVPPGMTRYPVDRRPGGPQGRSGLVLKISPPPGLDPRTVQPVASRYTDYAIPAHRFMYACFIFLVYVLALKEAGLWDQHAVCVCLITTLRFSRDLVWTDAVGGHPDVALLNFLQSSITMADVGTWGWATLASFAYESWCMVIDLQKICSFC
jgi:hypothetical protein